MDGDGSLDIVSTAAATGTVRWHKNAGLGVHRLTDDCGAAQVTILATLVSLCP